MTSLPTPYSLLPTSPTLSAIVAMAHNNVIGHDGGMPWRQSGDLKRFKQITMGHHLIMGRKTFASLGRVLPGRTSIVLSRQTDLELPAGVLLAADLAAALQLCGDDPQPFVIGGGEIYRLALPRITRLYLTRIDAELSGDTRFPEINFHDWRQLEEEKHAADAKNEYPWAFQVWERG